MIEMRLLCLTLLSVRGVVTTTGPNLRTLWNLQHISHGLSTGSSQQDKVPPNVDTVGPQQEEIQKYTRLHSLVTSKKEQEINDKNKRGDSAHCQYQHGAWSSCHKLAKMKVRQDTLKIADNSGTMKAPQDTMKNTGKSASMKAQKYSRLTTMGPELNQNGICPPHRTVTSPCEKRNKHKFGQCVYVSRHRIPWLPCQVSGIMTKKLWLVLQRPGVNCPPHKILAKVCQNKHHNLFPPHQIKAQFPLRPKCFMALSTEESHSGDDKKEAHEKLEASKNYLGQVVIELRLDTVPRTAENWRVLCEGTAGFGYAGTWFHRIVRGVMVQGGALGETPVLGPSIYGRSFPDENFVLSHNSTGVVAMANSGTDSNGSQFFMTLRPTPWLDGRHVVLGRVVDGMDVLYKVSELGSNTGNVVSKVVIQSCRCQH